MIIGLYEIVSFIGMVLLGLFAFFLVTLKKGNRLGNIIFAVFLFSKCLGIINHLIFHLQVNNPHVYFLLNPFGFLFGPALYFYVRSLTFRDFKFKKRDVIHLLPFVSVWIFFSWIFHFRSTAVKLQILTSIVERIPFEEIIMTTLLFVLVAFYVGAAILILKGYRNNLKEIYSTLDEKNLLWLNMVVFGFAAIWMFDIAGFVMYLSGIPHLLLSSMTMALIFIFANFVVFTGLKQPEIFTGAEQKVKYLHSPLTQAEKEQYLKQLHSFMESERPYLNPSLTILNLSKKLSISSRYLSQVINESLGVNFYDYVNQYRIEEAKRIMADTTQDYGNILDVLFDSGFNSKSAFNRVFKNLTGMTPSQCKQLHSH